MVSPLLPQHIISKCSNSCVPGEFKKTAEGQHTCCYECINCTENYYANNTGKTPLYIQWMSFTCTIHLHVHLPCKSASD